MLIGCSLPVSPDPADASSLMKPNFLPQWSTAIAALRAIGRVTLDGVIHFSLELGEMRLSSVSTGKQLAQLFGQRARLRLHFVVFENYGDGSLPCT